MATRTRSVDMVNGPLIKGIFIFTLPLIATALLQLLYNTADMIILGNFSPKAGSVAAVGATGAITNLVLNLFLGLSIGVNVVSGRYFGQGNKEGLSAVTHTAVTVSFIGGVVLGVFGIFASRPLLNMVNVDGSIIDQSVTYMRIIFAGLPAQMVYNFGSALLRSVGETKRPMYFLMVSGAVNVLLNLFFVVVCRMAVEGVALATVISQCLSAVLVLFCLSRMEGGSRLSIKRLGIRKKELSQMVKFGLPAGIQQSMFTFSHVILQSEINSYGADATAGDTAANNLENFVYIALFQFSVAALTFVSQNMGAKNYPRVKQTVRACILLVGGLGILLGGISVIFREPLLRIYLPNDPAGVEYGMIRFVIISLTDYFLIMQDICVGALRAMGYSLSAMLVSVFVIFGSRLFWLYVIYPIAPSITLLYFAYPLSWILAFAAQFFLYRYAVKRKLNALGGEKNG